MSWVFRLWDTKPAWGTVRLPKTRSEVFKSFFWYLAAKPNWLVGGAWKLAE